MKPGALVSYTKGGLEYVHALVSISPDGAHVKSALGDFEELVPLHNITGSVMAILYFDPTTIPADQSGVPVIYASAPSNLPPEAGTLRVVGASMVSGKALPRISTRESLPGEYELILARDESVNLTVETLNSNAPATATLSWSEELAGRSVTVRIYHHDYPAAGDVRILTHFLP